MRTIKFRAWDKDSSEMFYTTETMNCYDQFFWFEKGELKLLMPVEEGHPEVRDAVMMQFTGLHDKHGKEIYEGDLIPYKFTFEVDYSSKDFSYFQSHDDGTKTKHKIEICNAVVVFADGEYHLEYNGIKKGFWLVKVDLKRLEIIGNIHEHPHLIN